MWKPSYLDLVFSGSALEQTWLGVLNFLALGSFKNKSHIDLSPRELHGLFQVSGPDCSCNERCPRTVNLGCFFDLKEVWTVVRR